MTPSFDRFVAIDWSGDKRKRYKGIAVAECPAGDAPPTLIAPPAGWWSRQAVFDWLLSSLQRGPALVGIDCAFSLPFAVARHYFSAEATVFDLWDLIESVCGDHADYCGVPFVEHTKYGSRFWGKGNQPAWYVDYHRLTEQVCHDRDYGNPQSPYKLIGAKQVGKASLAGMRVLRALRNSGKGQVVIWPFEEPRPGKTVCVEIYPRLFLKPRFGSKKIRAPEDVDAALAHLGSRPAVLRTAVSDHDADALVSAAGLRWLAARPEVWSPAALDDTARRQEGWIFGVGDRVNAP